MQQKCAISKYSSVPGFAGITQWVIPNIKNWDNKISYVAKPFKITSSKTPKEPPMEFSKKSEFPNEVEVLVYPNPSKGQFTIDLNNTTYKEIFIYSTSGQLVYSKNIENMERVELDLYKLSAGVYQLYLNGVKTCANRKIIISK